MKRSNRLIILIGVFLAMIAFVGVVVLGGRGGGTNNGGNSPSASPSTSTVMVVAAKTQIKVGEKITTDNVELKEITQAEMDQYPDAFTSVQDAIAVGTVGVNLNEGDILRKSDYVPFGAVLQGQDIAPLVGKGMRAVAVDVDDVNGVGTLIVPNDHVDVILSVYVPYVTDESVDPTTKTIKWKIGSGDVTTKVVIQNRKVLQVLTPPPSVDTTTGTQAQANPSITPKPSDNTVRMTTNHIILILEVTPQETEVIRWAQRAENKTDGWNYLTLGLALRSPDDYNETTPTVTQGITFRQLVTLYQVLPVDPRGWLPADLVSKIAW